MAMTIRRPTEPLILASVILTLCLCLSTTKACSQGDQGSGVPGFFIFGDSLVDNGNNNMLLTLARANYRPYGVDFPQGTTGRFTNGRTFVDVLGKSFFFFFLLFFSLLNYVHVHIFHPSNTL